MRPGQQKTLTYLDHFGLAEPPFRLTPDPDFVYESAQHLRVKSNMESTIWLDDGFVVITGEVGSGKTTMLQSFITELEQDTVCAVVSQTQLNPTEFLEATLCEFGFKPFGKGKVELLSMLNEFLIEQHANGRKVVLIVDEAQNLNWKVLEEIRLLSGIESQKDKVLRIILVGQPELRQILASPQLKQLMQRVRCRFHLPPLEQQDIAPYVMHRLAVAGNQRDDLFARNVFQEIYRYSGGVPRLINTLCDTALLVAFADDKEKVTLKELATAIEELGWSAHQQPDDQHRSTYVEQLAATRLSPSSIARIDVRQRGKIVNEFYFDEGHVIVGRSNQCGIELASKFVSQQHAELIFAANECMVRDLGSTNGIYISGDRVNEHRLQNRGIVTIGDYELIYTNLRADIESSTDDENNSGEDSSIREALA